MGDFYEPSMAKMCVPFHGTALGFPAAGESPAMQEKDGPPAKVPAKKELKLHLKKRRGKRRPKSSRILTNTTIITKTMPRRDGHSKILRDNRTTIQIVAGVILAGGIAILILLRRSKVRNNNSPPPVPDKPPEPK